MSGDPTLRLDDVTVAYGRHLALRGVTFAARGSESVALVGANGSGKTTMLKVIAGLVKPTTGHAALVAGPPPAFVTQHGHHHPWMPLTAGEIIEMGRFVGKGLLGRMEALDRAAIDEAMERAEVAGLVRKQFGDLSGGQQQRVLVARALAQRSNVLLLDEPITGLDLASQERILDIVDQEAARGALVVLSTHHLDEARRCSRVVLLDGQVVADGTPAEVLTAEHLRKAYGGRVITAESGTAIILDDHGHTD